MATCIRQRGLARAARVRDRLPRGAFGERGDVPKDPMKGEAAPRAEAALLGVHTHKFKADGTLGPHEEGWAEE